MCQYGRIPTNAAIRRMAAMAPRIPHRRGRGWVGTSFTLRIAAMSDRSPRWENVFGPRGLPAGEGSRDSGGEVAQPADVGAGALEVADQLPVGGDERKGEILGKHGVRGVVGGDTELQCQIEGVGKESGAGHGTKPKLHQILQAFLCLIDWEAEAPYVLPKDVVAFDEEKIGDEKYLPNSRRILEQLLGLVAELFGHKKLGSNTGVNNPTFPQRSRSSRMSSTASGALGFLGIDRRRRRILSSTSSRPVAGGCRRANSSASSRISRLRASRVSSCRKIATSFPPSGTTSPISIPRTSVTGSAAGSYQPRASLKSSVLSVLRPLGRDSRRRCISASTSSWSGTAWRRRKPSASAMSCCRRSSRLSSCRKIAISFLSYSEPLVTSKHTTAAAQTAPSRWNTAPAILLSF